MKYRRLTDANDYTFGQGTAGFLVNSPETVAQAVATRLRLALREWFLDLTEGTPYQPQVLGKGTVPTYDLAIQQRILDTAGVTDLDSYQSSLNPNTRHLSVTCRLNTQYGTGTLTLTSSNFNPHLPGALDSTFILDQSILVS